MTGLAPFAPDEPSADERAPLIGLTLPPGERSSDEGGARTTGLSPVLSAFGWPGSRLEDAVGVLALAAGLCAADERRPRSLFDMLQSDVEVGLGQRLDRAAQRLGLEVLPVETTCSQLRALVASAGPAILRFPPLIPDQPPEERSTVEPCFLLMLPGKRAGKVRLIAPDGAVERVDAGAIAEALYAPFRVEHAVATDRLLSELGVRPRRRARARDALLLAQFGFVRLDACWLLRAPPSRSFWAQIRELGLNGALGALVAAHATEYALIILGWSLLGRGALEGRLDTGWLWGWGLSLMAIVPLRTAQTAAQGKIGVGFGCALKQRLFQGALRLDTDVLRRDGIGQLLGRIFESEAVEALALTGALLGLPSLLELGAAAIILSYGLGGTLLLAGMLGCVALLVVVARRYLIRLTPWTDVRLQMTHDLVEKMVGHRTRVAQGDQHHLHRGEDELLDTYLERGRALDRAATVLAVLPRAWLIIGLLGMAAAFVSVEASPATVGVALGGILLAHGALERLGVAITAVGRAAVSWLEVAPLFRAADDSATTATSEGLAERPGEEGLPSAPLIDGVGLVFRYSPEQRPVLRGCSLAIDAGDRVLIEGASGSGKSTLAAILAGLRSAESGLLLLRGLDRHTLGARAWRQMCAVTPQFHENHVLGASIAFNLLMGRGWPPTEGDLAEARSVCEELGLGDLLERMPNGVTQMVGETGWQLSQGERSRLFIARALLQKAPLIIFDESFGSLDPETAQQVFACVERRARTLVVIAHP